MKIQTFIGRMAHRNALAGRFRNAFAARILALLLLPALPAAVVAQFNYATANGMITITGYTGPGGAVTIPSTIDGLPVASIGTASFASCSNLTSVTIGDILTTIAISAFASCNNLTNVAIGRSVTSIEDWAFFNSTNLKTVSFLGDQPGVGLNVCYDDNDATIYYLLDAALRQSSHGIGGGFPGSHELPCAGPKPTGGQLDLFGDMI